MYGAQANGRGAFLHTDPHDRANDVDGWQPGTLASNSGTAVRAERVMSLEWA
jgi:hypothetical protein